MYDRKIDESSNNDKESTYMCDPVEKVMACPLRIEPSLTGSDPSI